MKTNYLLLDYENVHPKNLSLLSGHSLKILVFAGALSILGVKAEKPPKPELAIEAGVLPWPEDTAAKTAADLFEEWLAGRGTAGDMNDWLDEVMNQNIVR